MATTSYTEKETRGEILDVIQQLQVVLTKLGQVEADISTNITNKNGYSALNSDLDSYSTVIDSMLDEAISQLQVLVSDAAGFKLAHVIAVGLDEDFSRGNWTSVDSSGVIDAGTPSNNQYIKIESNVQARASGSTKPITNVLSAVGDKFHVQRSNVSVSNGESQVGYTYSVAGLSGASNDDYVYTAETGYYWPNDADGNNDRTLILRKVYDA